MTETIDLSAGTVDYLDTGGDGPTVILIHGLMMDASLWDEVVRELRSTYRCVVPTLPLGAHRRAMNPNAFDGSLVAIARLVEELLERLDVSDVTLVGNDTGGALVQLIMTGDADRVARAVLVSCDAFDNFPPGLTGKAIVAAGKLSPRLFGLFMAQMRLRPLRRLPLSFGWLTRRGDRVVRGWLPPVFAGNAVRRDAVRVLRAIAGDPELLSRVADELPRFTRPALIVWAAEDRVMPLEHGRALAYLLPDAALVEIADSYTLVPLDQPRALAEAIGAFAAAGDGATRATARATDVPPTAAPATGR